MNYLCSKMLNIRIKSILIFLIFLFIFLVNTHYTDADIFAERIVRENRFSMTTLDFSTRHSASHNPTSYLFHITGLQPGGFDVGAIRIKKEGKLGFKYHIKAVKTSGDNEFCNALNIQVLQRDLTSKFEGKLMSLSVDSEINDATPEDWIIFIGLDEEAVQHGKICEFNLNFKNWRSEPGEGKGIYAERVLNNTVSSAD